MDKNIDISSQNIGVWIAILKKYNIFSITNA